MGSWKEQLKQKFRNGCRGSGKCPISTDDRDKENQGKYNSETEEKDEVCCIDYTHYVEKLINEYDKDEPCLKKVRSLMKKTFS